MHNLAEHPKSIRAIAKRLLNNAVDKQASQATPVCATQCSNAHSEILYRVTPTAFLSEPEQDPVCLAFEADSDEHPLTFTPQRFSDVEEMNEWIMEFSQGRGDLGKQLYDQCSSNCSPRYTFTITHVASGLLVDTAVQCGLARDRKVDDYRISTVIRTSCLAADTLAAE